MKADIKTRHRQKRNGTCWRHPTDVRLRVPRKTAATIALMEMGITDYAVIAAAVDLDVNEVKQIDLTTEGPIRRLGVEGIPVGEYFNLRTVVCCPKCGAKVTIAPCVACSTRKSS